MEGHKTKMNNIYYILSAFQQEKYELYAQLNDVGILVINKIEKLSSKFADMSEMKIEKERIINKISALQEKGTIVIIEESIPVYSINATRRLLTDTFDGQLARDIYFVHFLSMLGSGTLSIPKEYMRELPRGEADFTIKTDDKGRNSYIFRREPSGEFRAILLLISAFVARPFDIAYSDEMFRHDNIVYEVPDRTIETLAGTGSSLDDGTRGLLAEIHNRYIERSRKKQ